MKTMQLNTRVDESTSRALDLLSEATGKKKARLYQEAIVEYLERQTAFLAAVEEGRSDMRAGRYSDLDSVAARLDTIIEQAEQTQQAA